MRCSSMASTIVQAKDVSHTVLYNIDVYPDWKKDLIKICNDAIRLFDPDEHNGLNFVKYILAKIKKDKFKKDLTWYVRAHCCNRAQVHEYCAAFDNHNYYNYFLQLKYNNLNIEILAENCNS